MDIQEGSTETRKIPVPSHRYTPLKENWLKIYTPIVEHLKLQIRFNLRTRHVEIKVMVVRVCDESIIFVVVLAAKIKDLNCL